jgi:integrase
VLRAKKRGSVYRVEGQIGRRYLRLSLGSGDHAAAVLRVGQIERALVEGPKSKLWPDLAKLLPPSTFWFLAGLVSYVPQVEPEPLLWSDLRREFSLQCKRRVAQGELRESTWERYNHVLTCFEAFLSEHGVTQLGIIGQRLVEEFKAWRLEHILRRKQSRAGTGLALDVAVLHGVFGFAVETEMISKNPVKLKQTPGRKPSRGAGRFTAEELALLRQNAGKDLLAFLLLRHTGLRGSDAVDLRWSEIHFDERMLERVTRKRDKPVFVPLHPELLFALETENGFRRPNPGDRVLLNPETGRPLTRPRLYERMLALGRRAGVANAHPHRFRDTLAVDLLLKGSSPYDVAKVLGDTVAVVEEHYAPFVRELQERVRRIIESPEGLEKALGHTAHLLHTAGEKKGNIQ